MPIAWGIAVESPQPGQPKRGRSEDLERKARPPTVFLGDTPKTFLYFTRKYKI